MRSGSRSPPPGGAPGGLTPPALLTGGWSPSLSLNFIGPAAGACGSQAQSPLPSPLAKAMSAGGMPEVRPAGWLVGPHVPAAAAPALASPVATTPAGIAPGSYVYGNSGASSRQLSPRVMRSASWSSGGPGFSLATAPGARPVTPSQRTLPAVVVATTAGTATVRTASAGVPVATALASPRSSIGVVGPVALRTLAPAQPALPQQRRLLVGLGDRSASPSSQARQQSSSPADAQRAVATTTFAAAGATAESPAGPPDVGATAGDEDTVDSLRAQLTREQERGKSLEAALARAKTTVSELQDVLRNVYLKQFERDERFRSVQSSEASPPTYGSGDFEDIFSPRYARPGLSGESSVIDLARGDDVASVGRRGGGAGTQYRGGSERSDVPSVLLALFRKVLELQSWCRVLGSSGTSARGLSPSRSNGRPSSGTRTAGSDRGTAGACGGGGGRSGGAFQWPGCFPPRGGNLVEEEVRNHLCCHGGRSVSRHELQAYIDSLQLAHVASAMVTQVILTVAGIDLGDGACSAAKFAAALLGCGIAGSGAGDDKDFKVHVLGANGPGGGGNVIGKNAGGIAGGRPGILAPRSPRCR
eukprot:TRINITY_DN4611_c0_g5_i1.p1 TRINITY_DN4611_c0_g5~~TRINITY_DN4611_c0_g5_i1.p1  ORF type:complete len:607 (+),score=125.08 TRINITY_DN4611_c0_g5_i1:60-1823(+)